MKTVGRYGPLSSWAPGALRTITFDRVQLGNQPSSACPPSSLRGKQQSLGGQETYGVQPPSWRDRRKMYLGSRHQRVGIWEAENLPPGKLLNPLRRRGLGGRCRWTHYGKELSSFSPTMEGANTHCLEEQKWGQETIEKVIDGVEEWGCHWTEVSVYQNGWLPSKAGSENK